MDECDLIMKGGVTSGIVYPSAILQLQKKYRFRSIGGTSAGAIAAAFTAAAELGRDRGGFERLAEVKSHLASPQFLLGLFQPAPSTAPLLKFALAAATSYKTAGSGEAKAARSWFSKLRAAWKASAATRDILSRTNPAAVGRGIRRGLAVAIIGGMFLGALALGSLALASALGWPVAGAPALTLFWLALTILLAALAWWVGGLVNGITSLAGIMVREIPRNGFGICTGRPDAALAGTGPSPALTDWVAGQLDRLAGPRSGSAPLVFGELRRHRTGSPVQRGGEPGIDLRVVTTNLSQRQPYVLPFEDDLFFFKGTEFERLFPPGIVSYLTDPDTQRRAKYFGSYRLPDGFYFLPNGDDLPVAVAVRMSLSFPILISAVPLYSVDQATIARTPATGASLEIKPENLQRNWFSDGGICSNFPIHFFDGTLPRRPTFGITLTSMPENAVSGDQVASEFLSYAAGQDAGARKTALDRTQKSAFFKPVYLPRAGDAQAPEWSPMRQKADGPFAHIARFLWSIFGSAQSYRDNSQSMLPSYRERIVRVRLKDTEGGLNLAMPESTIGEVMRKGEEAGTVLRDHFDMRQHQWVRYRVIMAKLESNLKKIDEILSAPTPSGKSYWMDELPERQMADDDFPYRCDVAWCGEARVRMSAIQDLMRNWGNDHLFDEAPPLPTPILRVTPPL